MRRLRRDNFGGVIAIFILSLMCMSCLLGRVFEGVVAEPWAALLVWGVPVALTAAYVTSRRYAEDQRGNPGLCTSCGYDLRGTPHRCPECGAVASNANAGKTKAAP